MKTPYAWQGRRALPHACLSLALFLSLSGCCGGAEAANPAAYVLPDTEVQTVPVQLEGRTYQVYVGLPEGYAAHPERRYPLLLAVDAPYAFPLLRSITRRVSDHGKALREHVLVGLSYAQGEAAAPSRNRDYTPSLRSDLPGEAYGGAPAMRRFIAEQLLPWLGRQYRIDMQDKTFIGHSYGGLLGTELLLNSPQLFERHVLSSPSLWFERGLMLRRAETLASHPKPWPTQVLLLAGARERPGRRREMGDDIVGDMQRFEQLLRRAGMQTRQLSAQVVADEDHLSVAPSAYTRGLRWAFGRMPSEKD